MFLIFVILETLILRIKKIKKTEPLIFLIFLILENSNFEDRKKYIKKRASDFFNFFNFGNYFWNSGRPELGNNYFFNFFIFF